MGVWMGLVDRTAVHEIAGWYFARQRPAGDIEFDYRDDQYNLSGFFPWEALAIDQYFSGCSSMLVTAAGAGREMIALARRGVAVEGFEANPALVARGRVLLDQLGLPSRLIETVPDTVPEGLGVYDGAIVGWGAYMHLFGREKRLAFLRKLRPHLTQGAPVLVSFFYRNADTRQIRWSAKIGSLLRRVLRKDPPTLEIGDQIEGFFHHRFNRQEIEHEFAAGGFGLAHYSEVGFGHAVAIAE